MVSTVLFLRFLFYYWSFIVLNNLFHKQQNVSLDRTHQYLGCQTSGVADNNTYRYSGNNLRSLNSKQFKPNQDVLTRIKTLGIAKRNRGTRAGRFRAKLIYPRGANLNNLTYIPIEKSSSEKQPDNRSLKLKISTVNTRSIRNKGAQLIQHVVDESIDLCVITETWLTANGDDVHRAQFSQCGYNFDDSPRLDRKGGGVALLYRENLEVHRLESGILPSFEFCTWKVSCKTFTINIIGLYRPPYSSNNRTTLAQFLEEFQPFLAGLDSFTYPSIALGDLNIHLNVPSDHHTKQFNSILETYNFEQSVTVPTHSSGNTLDAIISRTCDNLQVSQPVGDNFISDHCFVTSVIQKSKPQLTKKCVRYRNWKSSTSGFSQSLSNKVDTLPKINDVNEYVNQFNDTLTSIVNEHVPLKEKTLTTRPKVPWFSPALRVLKTITRFVERLHKKYKNEISLSIFKKMKNRYVNNIASAKDDYYNSRITDTGNNSKMLYTVISDILGRKKENPMPECSSDETLANRFLDFFTRKISNIRRQLDVSFPDITKNAPIDNGSGISERSLFSFKLLEETDVKKLIMQAKSTTCELDIIPSHILKQHLSPLLPVITNILNMSLEQGVFPDAWKHAVIKPLLKKKGLELVLNNYRPISNLPFLSKVLEKAALQQVIDHIEANHFLPAYQSAYRQHHGVETAMIKMYNDLLHAVDNQKVCIVVMIDLSAAFDTIDIDIINNILQQDFAMDGTVLRFFMSYLKNRTMSVVVNNEYSRTSELKYGVPQGSCAGPVIFTLYIAALSKVVAKFSPSLYGYADDHKLAITFKAGNSEQENTTIDNLESCLSEVGKWMAQNKLKMNNSKTEIIIYGNKQQLSKVNINSLNVCGSVVKCADSVRDLGVWMQSSLNFDLHIQKKCKLANHQLHNLKSIRRFLSNKSTETLVHGLIHSHLDFCNSLFIEQPAYQVEKLQKIQNRAARIVTKARYDHPAKPLLKQLHWLPVEYRIQYKVILLVHKCLHDIAPSYLRSLLVEKKSTHSYSLRQKAEILLVVPKCKTRKAERAFSVAGPRLWNALPAELRGLREETSFRRALKTHLFKEAFVV